MVELIILDMYGTLVRADVIDGVARDGLADFLNFYKEKKLAVFSDGEEDRLLDNLEAIGFSNNFNAVYGSRSCVSELFYTMQNPEFRREMLEFGRGNTKYLTKACENFSISPEKTIFIGDNFSGKDEMSAELNSIRFIKVPQFRLRSPGYHDRMAEEYYVEYEDSENPFSFRSLIGKL